MQNTLCEQIKNTAGVNISIIDFVHSIDILRMCVRVKCKSLC